MKKLTVILSLLLSLVLLFSACAQNNAVNPTQNAVEQTQKSQIRIGLLKGPTGMGASYLLGQNKKGEARADYTITLAGSPDVLTSGLISGALDLAALPVNAAATLYNKTEGKITLLAVNTLGVLYLLDKTDTVKTVADLKGKTVLTSGKGSAAEYAFNYILSQNGFIPDKDVTVEFAAEHTEAVTKALTGNYDLVLLPEPFVTQLMAKNPAFTVALNLSEEWEKIGNGAFTQGGIAVRTEFAENNPQAITAFMLDYAESVAYVNRNPEQAAVLCNDFEIASFEVAQKAIPNCNIVFLTGQKMKENAQSYLQVLFDAQPQSVGGKLPDEAFYEAYE